MRAMPEKFAFGEPVIVVSEPEAGLGLIAEIRRADCRVLFPRSGRSLWIPLRGIRAAGAAGLAGTIEEEIARLLSILGALEMEVSMAGDDRCRLIASHGAIRPETVDAVRQRLGRRLVSYAMRPQGMRRMQTVLEFVTGPEPRVSTRP